jgi:hypothetical protein
MKKLLNYLSDLLAEAVKSFSTGVLTAVGGDALDLWSMDVRTMLGIGGGAAVLAILHRLSALRVDWSNVDGPAPAQASVVTPAGQVQPVVRSAEVTHLSGDL